MKKNRALTTATSAGKPRTRGGIARKVEEGAQRGHRPSRVTMDILLTSVSSFLVEVGFEREAIAVVLSDLAKRVRARRTLRQARSTKYEVMVRVADIVRDWCWERPYTDRLTGRPRMLSLDGTSACLRGLIRRHFPDRKVDSIVSWMQENEVIARQEDGSFALTRDADAVVIANSAALLLERTAILAGQYLAAALANAKVLHSHERNVDRIAMVRCLPVKFLPQFREMVRVQTQSFLQTVDDWLESRCISRADGPTAEAGVHCYAYVAPPRPVRVRRTKSVNRPHRSAESTTPRP
jgi:hypothetical protein